ncbi:MAG: FtsX-like permease family protein [Ignavibacteria bacterium]
MSFERFIAKRYLISKKNVQFSTIITLISVIGISIGVAAIICVLSVFNGFQQYQITALTGFDPHLRIEPAKENKNFDYNSLMPVLSKEKEITGSAPYTLNKGVVTSKRNSAVIYIKGVDDKKINEVSNVAEETRIGEFKFEDNENAGGIILGLNLAAQNLLVRINDTVTVLSTAGMEKALTQIVTPKSLKFVVRGIYNANNKDYNKLYAFISIPYSQKLFDMGNSVSGIELRLSNIDKSADVKEELSKTLGAGYNINTWFDMHQEFYSVLITEHWTAYIILTLIIAVAAFAILGSLTMTVIEKRRDIGIMKAMGSTNRSIVRIFMFEGILIGIYGTIFGSLLGLGICLLQIKFKLYSFNPFEYGIDALPVSLRYFDFISVGLAALFLSFAASLYPAMKAAKQEPIKAIRWE